MRVCMDVVGVYSGAIFRYIVQNDAQELVWEQGEKLPWTFRREQELVWSGPFRTWRALPLRSHGQIKVWFAGSTLDTSVVTQSRIRCFIQAVCVTSPDFTGSSCCKWTWYTKLSLGCISVTNYSLGQNWNRTMPQSNCHSEVLGRFSGRW